LGEGHYVTMFYGVLDLAGHVLEYVNAGHCPPIVRHPSGATETLAPTRPVLGLLSQQAAGAERLRLRAGDTLTLYTDGITEAADESGEEFGPERLTKMLASDGSSTLQELHARIMGQVRDHASGKLGDDATLVLISVSGSTPAQTTSLAEPACSQRES
jgi:sigma-B regulation protein RsbU (phosphoserine phosphatase)